MLPHLSNRAALTLSADDCRRTARSVVGGVSLAFVAVPAALLGFAAPRGLLTLGLWTAIYFFTLLSWTHWWAVLLGRRALAEGFYAVLLGWSGVSIAQVVVISAMALAGPADDRLSTPAGVLGILGVLQLPALLLGVLAGGILTDRLRSIAAEPEVTTPVDGDPPAAGP